MLGRKKERSKKRVKEGKEITNKRKKERTKERKERKKVRQMEVHPNIPSSSYIKCGYKWPACFRRVTTLIYCYRNCKIIQRWRITNLSY